MKKILFLVPTLCLALTGCIDNNYDLADIDTTSEFQVKDLVLPVQLDPVVLNDIINVKEGDKLKEVTINGNTFYAVEQSGEFESNPIHINDFNASQEPLNPSTATFRMNGGASVKGKVKRNASSTVYYLIEEVKKDLDYEASGIDGSVRKLTYLTYQPVGFTMNLTTNGLSNSLNPFLSDVKIRLPKGLEVTGISAPGYTFNPSDYSASTGVLSISHVDIIDNAAKIVIMSDAVNLQYMPDVYQYNPNTNEGQFSFKSEFTIMDGLLAFNVSDSNLQNMPEEINVDVSYDISDMHATSILGEIAYDLSGEGLNIDPIRLNNLPEFLESDDTNLILANPQIYISLNNPVGENGLSYQSSLEIIAMRNGGNTRFPLGSEIVVPGKQGTFNYLLAPEPDKITNVPAEFNSGLTKIPYANLGNILSGNGLPETLDINLINPEIPVQTLTSPLVLGKDLQSMKGSYQLLAPLALEGDSRIIYTKTEDGWWDEDLADLTITNLVLTTVASSDIPLSAELTVYPLDKDGNLIHGLTINPVNLPANAKDANLEFSIVGEIRNLDGVLITATVKPDGSQEALSPNQVITLNNIRVKVSGNYTKKL